MRTLKKIFALSFAIIIVFSNSVIATFSNSNVEYFSEMEYAHDFLYTLEGVSVSIHTPIPLYNLSMQPEAVAFSVGTVGYIIVNLKDYDVPEYSLSNNSPFTNSNTTYIYNGPLNYYELVDKTLTHLKSNETAEISNLTPLYERSAISLIDILNKKESILDASLLVPPQPKYPLVTVPTWSTADACGVDGVAIMLNYWDLAFYPNFLPSGYEGNGMAQSYLRNSKYLLNTGMDGYDIVYGVPGATTGMKNYFTNHGLSSDYDITTTSFSFSLAKNQMEKGYILMAGTDSNVGPGEAGKYERHWVIPYTYKIVNGSINYFIINDGWGSNGITVSADPKYYPFGFVYIYER